MPKNGGSGAGIISGIFGILALMTGVAFYQQSTAPARSSKPPAAEKAAKDKGNEKPPSFARGEDLPGAGSFTIFLRKVIEGAPARDLIKEANERGISQVSFVVATIPDYVDSSGYWVADQTLEAIQRAAAAKGYLLDNYWLPDFKASVGTDQSSSKFKLHEKHPGIILFRQAILPDHQVKQLRVNLLVVFLINETPTAGIHQEAFLDAASTICKWNQNHQSKAIPGTGADGTLLVLGPSYSGSALSLRNAIKALPQCMGHSNSIRARIVSGTATNPDNLALLTFDNTSFSATVHDDNDLLDSLYKYLKSLNPNWDGERRVALISESNTGYGLSFQGEKSKNPPELLEIPPSFPNAIRMTFPIHISRLRGAMGSAQSQQGVTPATQPQGVSISMEERVEASDRIPSFAPGMTSAVVELILANILDTIQREHIAAVGIFATDKRDHLFLSREILKKAPNVLLFATETDLLFVHPDYGSFTRGTIVASTYPLFSGAQWLTDYIQAKGNRMQFPSMGTQGTYNAMLALLSPECFQSGRTELLQDKPCWSPLDYSIFNLGPDPSAPKTGRPPVWISVAGRDALWPITMMEPPPSRYTVAAPFRNYVQYLGWITLPPLAIFLFVVIAFAAIGHGAVYFLSIMELPASPGQPPGRIAAILQKLQAKLQNWADDEVLLARFFDSRRESEEESLEEPVHIERRRFLLICFTILGLIALWMSRLFLAGIPVAWTRALQVAWFICLCLFIFAVVGGFAGTLIDRASLMRRIRKQSKSQQGSQENPATRIFRHFVVATLIAFLMAIPALFAAIALVQFFRESVGKPPIDNILLLIRTMSANNGVSQSPAVLFTAAAVYLWALWNVRQLSMRGDYYDADSGLFRLLGGEPALAPHGSKAAEKADRNEPLRLELAAILASPWRRTRPWLLTGALVAVLFYGFFAWNNGYGIDGLYFSRFIWWITLLAVFMLAHSVSQTLHLAMLLGPMLRDLGAHPLAPAFKRIAELSLFDWRLSARPSRAWQLRPALRLAQSLSSQLRGILPTAKTQEPEYGILKTAFRRPKAATLQIAADALRHRPNAAFLRNDAWRILVAIGTRVQKALEVGPWQRSEQGKSLPWSETGENLLAMLVSSVIRDLLSRLVTGFTVALAMAVFICGAHLFYPFQGRHLFVWMDLAIVAILVVMGAWILIRFEKGTVLSHSWSTTPGQINLTGKLVYRVAIWMAITVLTILAARFPELGTNLTTWIEPFTKNLP